MFFSTYKPDTSTCEYDRRKHYPANPLLKQRVICSGFLEEMFRVRLLSMPQHIMERVINEGPSKLNLPWFESHVLGTHPRQSCISTPTTIFFRHFP